MSMNGNREVIHIRGGLGNQVIQAALGICSLDEQNHANIEIQFNTAKPRQLHTANNSWKIYYLNELFGNQLNYSINSKSTQKSKYWIHGAAIKIAQKTQYLCSVFGIPEDLKLKDEAVVHIRTADKKTTNDHFLYSKIIFKALSLSDKVRLIGDDLLIGSCSKTLRDLT